jgi:hypothetical protein
MAVGRPTDYNPEMALRICDLVATHDIGLPRLCEMYPELPRPQTINAWRREKLEFSSKYAQAKMEQAELMAESIDDIARDLDKHYYVDQATGSSKIDTGMVAHARLMIDTRKWLASKLAPKIYGDRKIAEEQSPTDTLNKIQALVADLNKTNVSDI